MKLDATLEERKADADARAAHAAAIRQRIAGLKGHELTAWWDKVEKPTIGPRNPPPITQQEKTQG